jgi:site-specific DNA recombinase
MRTYYAYIRVSTTKQGELGSSLQEQRSAIEAYAQRHGLTIGEWIEEMETAAKVGRRLFNKMLVNLERGCAAGLIIHKIDRSARNLKDWARLGDLIDQGVQVHFAHEAIDLASRGGRLSADIQAVVAADFIRNHRQEVRKGIYGRIKQGIYPLPAPRGYLDCGKGRPKEIDPDVGPLVQQAFDLYASGGHTLQTLRKEMERRGLRSRNGRPLSLEAMSCLLRNPFYCGLIRVKRTEETFEGVHLPLVSKATFDRVQAVLSGRVYARPNRHAHIFRRLIRCAECGYSLIGETRKGHVYYRCHSLSCRGTSLRETDIDKSIRTHLGQLRLPEPARSVLLAEAQNLGTQEARLRREWFGGLKRDLGKCDDRLVRLTDAFLDDHLDKETFEARKGALLAERRSISLALEGPGPHETFADRVVKYLGRAETAKSLYEAGSGDEKRDTVKSITSDLRARGKSLQITMFPVFQVILEGRNSLNGAPHQVLPRILGALRAEDATNALTSDRDVASAAPEVSQSSHREMRAVRPSNTPGEPEARSEAA